MTAPTASVTPAPAARPATDLRARDRGPSVKAVRDVLPPDARERSTLRGLAYFAGSAVVYLATLLGVALPMPWPARVAAALAAGLATGLLFVVGHDACHGSLTPHARLNAWLGRVALLPSLHPYVAWVHSHNALHHGWTNLRGRDPVYAPRTLAEYRALPRWRQRAERSYRTWGGVLALYLAEIWWRLEIRPCAEHRAHMEKRGSFVRDRALVLAVPVLQAIVLGVVAVAGGASAWAAAAVAALGCTVPFLTFTWLIGFATFQHHTHPRVVWYADEREWSFYRSQVQGTVHVVFPRWVSRLLHNIMEHTAHHVDTRVPLYHLTGAQRAVEAAFGPEEVITVPFSFRETARTFRACQLYDYDAHRWLSFDGEPTTPARDLDAESRLRAGPPDAAADRRVAGATGIARGASV